MVWLVLRCPGSILDPGHQHKPQTKTSGDDLLNGPASLRALGPDTTRPNTRITDLWLGSVAMRAWDVMVSRVEADAQPGVDRIVWRTVHRDLCSSR